MIKAFDFYEGYWTKKRLENTFKYNSAEFFLEWGNADYREAFGKMLDISGFDYLKMVEGFDIIFDPIYTNDWKDGYKMSLAKLKIELGLHLSFKLENDEEFH